MLVLLGLSTEPASAIPPPRIAAAFEGATLTPMLGWLL